MGAASCGSTRHQLFPDEQARIVQLLVERVDVRLQGVEVRLRPNGIAGLVREVTGSSRRVSADGDTMVKALARAFRWRRMRRRVRDA